MSKDQKILIIGAGGLGCELLKNVIMNGYIHVHILDMDHIELSNLNRQFLFQLQDVGRPKASVAAERISSLRSVEVISHVCKLQDKDPSFFRSFSLILCGLDSLDARRYLNALLIQLVDVDAAGLPLDVRQVIPWIDCGCEGLQGHVKVIVPRISACLECAASLFPAPVTFPLCTLASTPRRPEHCVEHARVIQWPAKLPFGDDFPIPNVEIEEHMCWIAVQASKRAMEFGINNNMLNAKMVRSMIKRSVPAVASTNAVIAAACVTEVFKYFSECAPVLDNSLYVNLAEGYYAFPYENEKVASCLTFGLGEIELCLSSTIRIEEVLQLLKDVPYLLSSPSLSSPSKGAIYFSQPASLMEQTSSHLSMNLLDFTKDYMICTDPILASTCILFKLSFH